MKVEPKSEDEVENRLIGVVLGTNHKQKRVSASTALLNYGKENFYTIKALDKDQQIGKSYISSVEELEVVLKAEEDLYLCIKKDETLKAKSTYKDLAYPIYEGDEVGQITYFTENEQNLGQTNIVSDSDACEMDFKVWMKKYINEKFDKADVEKINEEEADEEETDEEETDEEETDEEETDEEETDEEETDEEETNDDEIVEENLTEEELN